MNSLLIIGAILILVVLSLLLRLGNLVSVLKYTGSRETTSNKVNAFLFIVFLVVGLGAFFWLSNYAEQFYLPEASSVNGVEQDQMFWTTMYIITIVFVVTHILLFVFPYLYQFKETRKASYYPDNHKLELIWTVIPALVLTVLVIGGWKLWSRITAPVPADHVKIEIVGKQFNWMVRYPGKDNTFGKHNYRKIDATNVLGIDYDDKASYDDVLLGDEITIPVGKPVQFQIRSRDVLHSVFAMHFRQKMDAVPGMPTSFWFTPTKTTNQMRSDLNNPDFVYEIACTEVCGQGHFGMRAKINVVEESEYNDYLATLEPFLKKNPDYLAQIPEDKRAFVKAQLGIKDVEKSSADSSAAKPATTTALPVGGGVSAAALR